MSDGQLRDIASLYGVCIPQSLLARLGALFCANVIRDAFALGRTDVYAAIDGDETAGFCIAVNHQGWLHAAVGRHPVKYAFLPASHAVKPRVLSCLAQSALRRFRCAERGGFSTQPCGTENELFAIAVSPNCRNRGIAIRLSTPCRRITGNGISGCISS